MADTVHAARVGDPILHTSVWAEILATVAEAVVYAAVTAAVIAAAPYVLGAAAVAAAGAVVIGVGAGLLVTATSLIPAGEKSIGEHFSDACSGFFNALIPPTPQGNIASGSVDTRINSELAARAAGIQTDEPDEPAAKPSVMDTILGVVAGLNPVVAIYQTIDAVINPPMVATPASGTRPAELDQVVCMRHLPMPTQYLAEGSSEVFINSQPAARCGDRTTCEATVGPDTDVSPDVRIGGEPLVVRPIQGGKSKIGMVVGIIAGILIARKFGCTRIFNAGNPVAVSTGSKFQDGPEDLDFTLPGILPIVWARRYNSLDRRDNGLFGVGWSVFYEVEIVRVPHPDGGDLWVYINAEGERLELGQLKPGNRFVSTLDGLAFFEMGNGLTVVEDIHDGLYQVFETDPHNPQRSRLVRLGDRNRNTVNLHYDDQGKLLHLLDPNSRITVRLRYNNLHPRRVEQVERLYFSDESPGHLERTEPLVRYRYDSHGDLSAVLDTNDQVLRRFTYTPERYMSSHTLPTGATRHYAWAPFAVPEQGPQPVRLDGTPYTLPPLLEPQPDHEWRVIRHWGSDGEDYRFEYDLAKGETRVVDSLGREESYYWGALYEVYHHIDTLGQCRHSDLLAGQLLKTTDPQGGEWHYVYDDIGRLIETRDPLGRSEYILYTEHWALPLSITDRGGHTRTFSYDERGNLLSEKDPLGHTTRYRYDPQGQVVEIIDAHDKHKTLAWNRYGQLMLYRDCSNSESHYRYDERGYLSSSTNARGETTQYRYDTRGHLIESERPDGRIDRYQRNLAGQLTDYIDPANLRTQYHYDPSGRIQQRIDALGHKVRFSYDAYGRLQQLSNENNEAYRFEWDVLDRLTTQIDLDDSYRVYHYNAVDDITGTDAHPTPAPEPRNTYEDGPPPLESDAPIRHRFTRDAVGRLLRKTTDDGVTDYAYDPADNLLAITFKAHNGEQQQLEFRYDALGQLLSESSDAGELGYRYDALGNLETLTLPDQRQLNHLYYGSGHLHQLNLNGRVICDFERDQLHDEVLRTQGSLLTRTRYDRSGRLSQKALHYRNAAREELPLLQKNYQYDASDNLIIERLTQTQRRGGSDPRQPLPDDGLLGRFLGQSHGKSVEGNEHYIYDATERLRDHRHSTPQNPELHRETYNYDAAANLLQSGRGSGYVKQNRVHVFENKRYRYDRFGRLSEKRIGSHTVQRFRYDAEQRLVCVEQDQGWQRLRSEYQYDPLGRRIGKRVYRNDSEQPQSDVQFVWQGLRLLQEVEHGFGSVYVYADPDSYEPLARIDGKPGSEEIFYFHTNLAGLPEQLTDETGLSIWHSEYEGWGKSRDEWHDQRIRRGQNLRFQGQYLDRETGLHYNTFRFYDADVGRFTQPDPIGLLGGLNLYQYAPNPIDWVDPWGLSACAPTHHIATNKHKVWSERFRALFKQNGLGKFKNGKSRKDVLNDPLNKIDVPGHKGPHPEGMHQKIFDRLERASERGRDSFIKEMNKLRAEATTPGTWLNNMLTKVST
ncbi:RHS repeat-associated core domain-containing protein [Pseudomonas fluorescens]|uniref:RHS repeat-associated core domain-containing protein n=1 Tax=Pseudomonas fluorescens TaxID=294 RepID=UPI0013990E32|nr:RHS repeat-associated core domain-containing protein [Pseudomonas fluorescens]QIA03428.1 type IV secretion protein Rhs [Pseudomonas fluorescens]